MLGRIFYGFRPFSFAVRHNMRKMATTTEVQDTNFVLVNEIGDKGIITLNRPETMNTVNYEMAHKISKYLKKWQTTKSMVLIKSSGLVAFCSGGDTQIATFDEAKQFLATEYKVDNLIGNLNIPYVAFIDGITMGGGAGLSVHGKFRIATDKTTFAMPEVTIGLIPDAGGSYFLPRLPNKLGYYIGLTGTQLRGPDVLHAGIATHYCDSFTVPEIEKALLSLENSNEVEEVINRFCPKPKTEFTLNKHLDQINKTFDARSVEEILSNLEKDGSEWAKQTIKALRQVCPLSVKLTLRELNLGANLSLEECLKMEYRVILHCIQDSNFHEGVRAFFIQKDGSPIWNPSRIEDIPEEKVLSFFQPLPNNEDLTM